MAINNVNNNTNINRVDTNNTATNNKPACNQGSLAGLTVKKEQANGTRPLSIAQANQAQAANALSARAANSADPAANALRQQINGSRTLRGNNNQVDNVLVNNFNLPSDAFTRTATATARNAAGQTTSSKVALGKGSVTLFDNNGSFPPSSTATLPRPVFDKAGILSFYQNANSLTDAQRSFVQNVYATDLSSRANYQANVTNLAKNLTDISKNNNLSAESKREVNDALSSLKSAYNTLANPTATAPDPRALYKNVAEAYRALSNDPNAPKSKVSNGLNILSISASNYDLNRLPVGNNPTPPAAPAAAANATAAAKLAASQGQFDTRRNQPLSDAQASPAKVFGKQVSDFLSSIGINNVNVNNIAFQSNSADQLQAIQTRLADGRRLTALFSNGMINAANAKVAFR
jgi:hypothetical protein